MGSVLVSQVVRKDQTDTRVLGYNLWLCWCLRAMPSPMPCLSEWPTLSPGAMVLPGSGLLPKAEPSSMALLHPGSVLMSLSQVTTKGHIDARGLCYNLWPCWWPRAMLPLGAIQIWVICATTRAMVTCGPECCLGPCLGSWS